jgi:alpha-ribazole phosphatase
MGPFVSGLLLRVRHAPVTVRGVCYGRADVEVAVEPRAACDAILANADRVGGLASVARIVTSPARRTRSLADVLGAALGRPVGVDERLSELDFGEWELRQWDALEVEDGERLRAWMARWRTTAPPGGECVDELVARVRSFRNTFAHERVLAVTHAGPMRALRALARGVDYANVLDEPVEHLVLEQDTDERPG